MTITYRKGIIEDSYSVFQVFVKTSVDYSERMNVMVYLLIKMPSPLWRGRLFYSRF